MEINLDAAEQHSGPEVRERAVLAKLKLDQAMNSCCTRKRGVTLDEASVLGCRWPIGENRRGLHLFCDEPRLPGRRFAWCEEHYAMGTSGAASRERARVELAAIVAGE
jgi:hypothetical protein